MLGTHDHCGAQADAEAVSRSQSVESLPKKWRTPLLLPQDPRNDRGDVGNEEEKVCQILECLK